MGVTNTFGNIVYIYIYIYIYKNVLLLLLYYFIYIYKKFIYFLLILGWILNHKNLDIIISGVLNKHEIQMKPRRNYQGIVSCIIWQENVNKIEYRAGKSSECF